jgi:hypothetical protein
MCWRPSEFGRRARALPLDACASGPPRALRSYDHIFLIVDSCAPKQDTHATMGPGVNLATTKDGGTYNKLQRPLDYLMSPTAPPPPPPPKNTPLADTTCASKRKLEHANFAPTSKRTRTGEDSTRVRSLQSGIASKEQSRVLDCGMKTTLPGLDDERYSSDEETSEALAYLRNVR